MPHHPCYVIFANLWPCFAFEAVFDLLPEILAGELEAGADAVEFYAHAKVPFGPCRWRPLSPSSVTTSFTLPIRRQLDARGAEATSEPFAAFPSWFMRIECDRCGKVQMVNETHAPWRQRTLSDILRKMRHDGCGGLAAKSC